MSVIVVVQCAKKVGVDFAMIKDCMNSTAGNRYEHEMAQRTEKLRPHVTFVPWITLNSVMILVIIHGLFTTFISNFMAYIVLTSSSSLGRLLGVSRSIERDVLSLLSSWVSFRCVFCVLYLYLYYGYFDRICYIPFLWCFVSLLWLTQVHRLTQVHLEKWPLKRCVCVCLCCSGLVVSTCRVIG